MPDAIADPVEAGPARRLERRRRVARSRATSRSTPTSSIVGTGAGGGTAAEILADAGLRVVLVEEGPLKSSRDFRMRESEAYPELYQESAARKTARQGDQHPAGTLRRRRHDGQLDELVPHAARHARVLAARVRPCRLHRRTRWRRGSRGWKSGCRSRRGTVAPNANNEALARGAAQARHLAPRRSAATSRAAGTSATAAWAARPTPSSRCW